MLKNKEYVDLINSKIEELKIKQTNISPQIRWDRCKNFVPYNYIYIFEGKRILVIMVFF